MWFLAGLAVGLCVGLFIGVAGGYEEYRRFYTTRRERTDEND